MAACAVLLLAAGCGKSPDADLSPKSWRHCAKLPGLSRTTHPGLQTEWTLLHEEQATPAQLAKRFGFSLADSGPPSRAELASDPRILLREAFPPMSRSLLRHRIERIDSGGPLRFDPVEMEDLRQLLQQTVGNRDRFRQALAACQTGLRINPAEGVVVDLEFLEPLEIGCRLELLVAAATVSQGGLAEPMAVLERHLAVVQHLAQQPNVAVRLAAAEQRADGLRLLQAIVLHPKLTQDELARCRTMILEQLKQWPADAQALIADRAAGLHTYELVRDGHYLSLLDRQEVERLEERGLLAATGGAVLRGVDGDQHFYLATMRRLIESSAAPYYMRRQTLQDIRAELLSLTDTPRHPLVAAHLLLADFEQAQRRMAEDRALCEAWGLALRAAFGEPTTAPLNPLTGERYQVDLVELQIVVSRILPDEADQPIAVPVSVSRLQQAGRNEPTPARR